MIHSSGKIHEDNFSYSILLSVMGRSIGSGFRLKFEGYNFIVTARHVIFNENGDLYGETLIITCHSTPFGTGKFTFEVDLSEAKIYKSAKADVCIILVGHYPNPLVNPIPLKNDKSFKKREEKLYLEAYIDVLDNTAEQIVAVDIEATRNLGEIRIANDVYLMGYPTSLGIGPSKYFDVTRPLVRKGIISGINISQGTFIIDCPSYQGNSGGPVVEFGEDGFFRVIGLVSQYIPYQTDWHNNREKIIHMELSNSGFSVCVPFDDIIEVAKIATQALKLT